MASAQRSVSGRLEKHLLQILTRLFRPLAGTRRFGIIEALGYGSEIDHWMRYAHVVECLRDYRKRVGGDRPVTVLDVGGGPAGLASLLRDPRFRLVAVDPKVAALRSNQALKVVGDGCRLPFATRGIDVVVSVDSLEHVAADRRLEFLKELDRVTRSLIVIHCPLDSLDRRFQGTRYDKLFQRLHRRDLHGEEANTAEHLRYGLPTVELIRSVFPEASIHGLQNCDVWVRLMMGGRRRWWRVANGLCYLWSLKPRDDRPPFHGALTVVTREASPAPSSGGRRATVSAVVLTKNEESRIARCLASLQWMDEVVVVDGQSQDRTVEICRQSGARVIQRAFSGSFAEERNAGLEAATSEWVLQLDADDVVTAGMREAVTRLLSEDDRRCDVYKFRRRSIFLGHRLVSGGWAPYVPYLVRRTAVRFQGLVHEHPVTVRPIRALDAEVDHYFCDRYAELVSKLNRYSTLTVQEWQEAQERFRRWDVLSKLVLRPMKLFWKIYIKKQGFRDGPAGLIMALNNSWSHVVIAAKWWERCRGGPTMEPTFSTYLGQLNHRSTREADALWDAGARLPEGTLVRRLWLKPMGAFMRTYRREGYRQGWYGFFISVLSAYESFVLCVKLWEHALPSQVADARNPVSKCAIEQTLH